MYINFGYAVRIDKQYSTLNQGLHFGLHHVMLSDFPSIAVTCRLELFILNLSVILGQMKRVGFNLGSWPFGRYSMPTMTSYSANPCL